MQEALQKLKEDEERAIKEQEEKERRIEEALKAKEEEVNFVFLLLAGHGIT